MKGKLFLLRHGQSVWNKENRFTGFVDVELSEKGQKEALNAGELLKDERFDVVFVSALQRAKHTADLALSCQTIEPCPRIENASLNERHYGDLQGLNKDDVRKQYGSEQVHIWRRSYDIAPPGGESLKQTCDRVIPYYKTEILPRLVAGNSVLIVAHGNSLRGLMKELENLSDKEVVKVEIPTGVPVSYDIDSQGIATNKMIYNPREIS